MLRQKTKQDGGLGLQSQLLRPTWEPSKEPASKSESAAQWEGTCLAFVRP